MRVTKPLTYQSMLQIAGKGGCVICAFLKNIQSAWLDNPGLDEGAGLCNYHGWAIAAAGNGKAAAETFLRRMEHPEQDHGRTACNFCERLLEEEKDTLKELSHALNDPKVLEWLEEKQALCLRHARKLAAVAGPANRERVMDIGEAAVKRLRADLQAFLSESTRGAHSGGGALGRAAELLFGYRGLPRA